MNVNELADMIEFDAPIVGINKEAADMLRKLQSDLELLEAKRGVAYSIGYEDGRNSRGMDAMALADYLDDNVEAMYACEQVHIGEAATMLRQLQTECDRLYRIIELNGRTE